MTRYTRINTIWRKELIDTLRDRRTLIAMVLVPMVLYPALMLGSIQAFEVQVSYLVAETYTVGVPDHATQAWLRRLIDIDPLRHPDIPRGPAEDVARAAEQREVPLHDDAPGEHAAADDARAAEAGVREKPPPYRVVVVPDVSSAVLSGAVQVGVRIDGRPPAPDALGSTAVQIAFDDSDIRSEIAAAGVEGVLQRAAEHMLARRLAQRDIGREFIQPLAVESTNVASAERMAGSALGQIVPLILILMTITGAIYPAIDLTAGERERGTLETLMAAPVPTSDLVVGKFIVITLIGLMSAVLNLLSVGGTIYLGGVGAVLMPGDGEFAFPLSALPWVFVLLVPLAVMFSALLLAVCSFARSFKEAQNYVAPVMMAVLIPGVVGVLPGTRLEGPILIMPVANIVVLTRDLFLGKFDYAAIAIVALSTSLYAGAAIAIATKLFGQEAVLFANSGSIRTIFQRRFFKPRQTPSIAVALLLLALVFSLNFFIQNSLSHVGFAPGIGFLAGVALTLTLLFGVGPWLVTLYMRADPVATFRLHAPPVRGLIAALCFGCSTWLLVKVWLQWQSGWLPMDPRVVEQLQAQFRWMSDFNPWVLVLFLALVPALCEELFFRGFVLSGVRSSLNKGASILIVALAFGLSHYMVHKLFVTFLLGALLALLIVQFRSIFPAMLAHFMHNAISTLAGHPLGLRPLLESYGLPVEGNGYPPALWVGAALMLLLIGLALCATADERQDSRVPGGLPARSST